MSHAATPSLVLSDRLWATPSDRSRRIAREIALVAGFALVTAALAQFRLHLAFTPVPVTGQTLGVLLAGASLGARRGAASQALYWLLGLALPFYSGGAHGWTVATGGTFGYFVGFVLAAAVIGYMAQRRQDRTFPTSVAAMALGTIIIYICGAAWLAHSLGIPVAVGDTNAVGLGVTPFLLGDLIKLTLAGALLPTAWAIAKP